MKTKKRKRENGTLAVVLKRKKVISSLPASREKILNGLVHNTKVYTEEALSVVFDSNGSPIKVITNTPQNRPLGRLPLKYRILREKDLSPVKMRFFASRVRLCTRTSTSKVCHPDVNGLKLLRESRKGFENIEVTPERLNQWTSRLRNTDQNRVMGISAKDYVDLYGQKTDHDTAWDWLHLFAHSLGGHDGKNPQVRENLVAGTHACNILMLEFAETALKGLIKDHQLSGLKLSVFAELKPFNGGYTHIATKIDYCIKYQGRSVLISFCPLEKEGVDPGTYAHQIKNFLENSLLQVVGSKNLSPLQHV